MAWKTQKVALASMTIPDADQARYHQPYYLQKVHLFAKRGKKFAYLTRQMVALLLDDLGYAILSQSGPVTLASTWEKLAHRFSFPEMNSAFQTLIDWQILASHPPVSQPSVEEETFIDEEAQNPPSEIWLSLANDCNLRCRYCSAGYGRFGGTRGLMTEKTAARAMDLLFPEDPAKQKRDFANIIFVGGEPLMNYPVMAFAVDYAKRKAGKANRRISFHLNTNGTLLDEKFLQLFRENDFHVVFSIDGPPAIHDASRRFIDGEGSYRRVAANFSRFIQAVGKSRRAQAVLHYGSSLRETMTHLLDLGFEEVIPNPDYSSPLTSHNSAFDASALEEFAQQYDDWSVENVERILSRRWLHGNAHFLEDLRALHRRQPSRSSCGAGRSLAISAHGGIFPCQSTVETKPFQLGDLTRGVDLELRRKFIALIENLGNKCRGCWIVGACSRPCFQEAYSGGFLDDPEPTQRCKLYRSYFESAIYGYYLIDEAGCTELLD
jgi:uncharacterized protein